MGSVELLQIRTLLDFVADFIFVVAECQSRLWIFFFVLIFGFLVFLNANFVGKFTKLQSQHF